MFGILVISVSRGFVSGSRTAIGAAIGLLIFGYEVPAFRSEQGAAEQFIVPLSIAIVGYALSYWGGEQKKTRERLSLLKRVNRISNPRFGVARTLESIVEELRRFYAVENCILILRDAETDEYTLLRSKQVGDSASLRVEHLSPFLGRQLLSPAPHHSLLRKTSYGGKFHTSKMIVIDERTSSISSGPLEQYQKLGEILDAPSYLSTPFKMGGNAVGRFYVLSKNGHQFDESDLKFLSQLVFALSPQIENIRLVDRLASEAAEQERKKIARDIHDTTIQPFIGLKLGLKAVMEKLARGSDDISHDVSKLLRLTDAEIGELRKYVTGLKEGSVENTAFLDAVRRFTEKFTDASGISVTLSVDENLRLSDRLAAEVFQFVTEGLSNVRRHTSSSKANIEMSCKDEHLTLVIENENELREGEVSEFTPHSITERAASLGGSVDIVTQPKGTTQLYVSIPL
jgi:signal transduction histidine kinase